MAAALKKAEDEKQVDHFSFCFFFFRETQKEKSGLYAASVCDRAVRHKAVATDAAASRLRNVARYRARATKAGVQTPPYICNSGEVASAP
jgi:hypothetical protein